MTQQEDEEATNAALLDALGSDVFGSCGSMLERVAILVSQRDNAYNEVDALKAKTKTDLGRMQTIRALQEQIIASCKARAEAIPLTGETNWTRIELVYVHEHLTKEKSISENYERILKGADNGGS